jgi:hypothetical protein
LKWGLHYVDYLHRLFIRAFSIEFSLGLFV